MNDLSNKKFFQFHESKYEGGPNVTMFCTYKPKSCKMAEIPKVQTSFTFVYLTSNKDFVLFIFGIRMLVFSFFFLG